ncbi:MAG: protein-disulfide reductase DsbD domain-containing protein [Pseudomonadota bacterium]
MSLRIRHFLAALFALLAFASPLGAAEAPESGAGEKVTLISGNTMSAEPVFVGVRMTMLEGWHTYWRVPGDSGLAPTFDWSASKNVASVELLWPAPERFDAEGDTTFGYRDEVIWPVQVRALDPAQPLVLDLKMTYGVCKNICVPNEAHLPLTLLPQTAGIDETAAVAIHKFLARVPHAPEPPVAVTAKLTDDELRVILSNVSEVPVLIPEGPRGVWFGEPEMSQQGKNVIYKMPVEIGKGRKLQGSGIVLTFSGPDTAIEAKVKIE